MGRATELTELYKEKSSIISKNGCQTNFDSDLTAFSNQISNIKDGNGLTNNIYQYEETLKDKNEKTSCKLW
jgi:hypothetical protein